MFKIKIAIHDSDVVISTLSVFANSNKLLSIGIMICRKTIKGVLCWTWNLLCYDKVFNSMLYWPIKTWNKFSKILLHHTNYLYSTMDKLIIWCTKTQVASIWLNNFNTMDLIMNKLFSRSLIDWILGFRIVYHICLPYVNMFLRGKYYAIQY